MLVNLLALWFGDGGAAREDGSRATYLALNEETYKMEIEAIYSRIQEPNNETYCSGIVGKSTSKRLGAIGACVTPARKKILEKWKVATVHLLQGAGHGLVQAIEWETIK